MALKLFIDTTACECRVAVEQEGRWVAYHSNLADGEPLKGSLFYGRITSINPAMKAAFVDLGQGLQGMLKSSDAKVLEMDLVEGLYLIVQVKAEAQAGKALRVTADVQLDHPYMVLTPFRTKSALPKQAGDSELLSQLDLKTPVQIRSAGLEQPASTLQPLYDGLREQWAAIQLKASGASKPTLLHQAQDFLSKTLKGYGDRDVAQVTWQGGGLAARVREALPHAKAEPRSTSDPQWFETLGVEAALEEALGKRLDLPGGGWLSVEPTEALWVIDVNAGERVGQSRDAAQMTNSQAVPVILQQLALRRAGGMVAVDFISLANLKGKARATADEGLKDQVKAEAAKLGLKAQVIGLSRMGLFELILPHGAKPLHRCMAGNIPVQQRQVARQVAQQATQSQAAGFGLCLAPGMITDDFDWQAILAALTGKTFDTQAAEQLCGPDYRLEAR